MRAPVRSKEINVKYRITAALATVAIATSPAVAESVIERLAPDNTVLIAGAASTSSTVDRFKRTAMWRLWQSDTMQELMAGNGDETLQEMLDELYEELGVEENSLVPPSGEVGFVVFAATEGDMGLPGPAFMAYADYGDDADKTQALIQAALEKAERDDGLEWEEQEVDGWKITSVDLSKLQAKAADAEDDFGFDEGPGLVPGAEDLVGGFSAMHFVRQGNAFIFASNLEGLTGGLHRLEEDTEGIASREDYQAVRRLIGEADGFAVLLTRDLLPLVSAFDEMGMLMMMQPMIRSVFGEIAGYGFGVRLDAQDAMSEATMAITMPRGKAGLPALVDLEQARGDLPAFVGPDAISYSNMHFKFDELKDFIVDLVQTNPLLQMQLADSMPAIESIVEQVGATIGPDIHMVETIRRPLTLETIQSLVAVRCSRPQEFENLFKELGNQMSMEPRDFLGHRIYVLEMPGGMMPGMGMGGPQEMAVGIGGGYVFLGEPTSVEAALRTMGERDLPSLADEPAYARAIGVLKDAAVVMWGYSSTVDVMESREALNRLMQEAMIEQMIEQMPDFAEEIREEFEGQNEPPDLDFDLLRRYLGPTVWQVRSTDEGFLGKFYMLDAGGE
jgi:hypothetical protein